MGGGGFGSVDAVSARVACGSGLGLRREAYRRSFEEGRH
jgi:hypothetical protein